MTILDELPIKLTGMPPLNLTIRFLPADLKKLYPKRLLIKKLATIPQERNLTNFIL